jgi:GNAT superfamily N-acetyltransferase
MRSHGLLGAAWTIVRLRGLGVVVRQAWRRWGWGDDRLVVFVGPIMALEVKPGLDGLTLRQATASDLESLRSLRLSAPAIERIRTSIGRGDCWLQLADDGTRLVGYRLMTRGYWGYGVLAKVLRIEPHQVYVEGIFVRSRYRGHNLGHRLIASQNVHLIEAGFREYVAAVAADNTPSLRLTRRAGGRPVLFLDSRRRLFYHRCTVSPTMPPEVQRILDEGTRIE